MKGMPSSAEWAREFKDFVEAGEIAPPCSLSSRILGDIRSDLNPTLWRVFGKLMGIQAAVGSASLLLCPQFGIGPIRHSGLKEVLMSLGDHGCMLGCGAFFLGSSAFVASFCLRPEEIRVIRRGEVLQFALLGVLSLGAFVCLGQGIVPGLALLWFLGSVLGGVLTLELGRLVRYAISR